MQWILIQPDYEYNVAFPLTLAHVATYLKTRMEQAVFCFDLNLQSFDSMIHDIQAKNLKPDVFGISTTAITRQRTINICQKVKELYPDSRTVVGGAAAQTEYRQLLQNREVDFCFINDIEQTNTDPGALTTPRDLRKLPGTAFRHENQTVTNGTVPLTELDSFPFPDRKLDFIHIENYRPPDVLKEQHPATLVTSRGCPHNCTYCASARISGRKVVWRSAASVMEELDYLRGLGYNSFVFEDYEFLFNMPRAELICENLKNHSSRWILKTRVEKINADTARMLAESGCLVVYIGVETLTREAIEKAKKATVNVESVKKAVHHLKTNGIRVCASIQFGLPGDTEDQFIEGTVGFLGSVLDSDQDMVQLHFTTLFPGTELYDQYFPQASYVNIHNHFAGVIAHGFEGFLMPQLSEDVVRQVYSRAQKILGRLLTEKAIWFSH